MKSHFAVIGCAMVSLAIVLSAIDASAQQAASARTLTYQGIVSATETSTPLTGDRDITVRFYSDASGQTEVWHDTYHTHLTNGVFDLNLGSGPSALPSSEVMSHPIWVGMQIGNDAELRPLAPLSAAPFALAIADKSVTKDKMATDYVSSISLNGQKLSGQGTDINLVTGNGIDATVDPATNAIVLSGATNSNPFNGGAVQGNTTFSGSLTVTGNTYLGSSSNPTYIYGDADISGNLVLAAGKTLVIPGLTASRIVRTDGSSHLTTGAVDLTSSNDVTGALGVTNGGTGLSSFNKGDLPYASASNTLSALGGATGHDGYLLTWNNTTGIPEWRSAGGGAVNLQGTTPGTAQTGNINVTGTILGGTVGIGTTAPITQLHIPGNVPSSPLGSVSLGSSGNSGNIFVSGRYAYAIDGVGNHLNIADVSVPSSPVSISSTSTNSSPFGLYVSGNYAYVTTFVNGNSYMDIFDISDPKAPIEKSTTSIPSITTSIYVSGNHAYLADYGNDLMKVFDVSNPSSPVSVGSADFSTFPQQTVPWGVFVSGHYAYTANYYGVSLAVIDISDPANPTIVGSSTTGSTSDRALGVYVSGRYAYTVSELSNKFDVFDVSDPTTPVNVGEVVIPFSAGPHSVFVSGRYAYTANDNDKVSVIDISNPASPSVVGSVSLGTEPQGLYISGRYAYTIDYDGTLKTIDLGGAYIQSLEAGSTETGQLQVRNDIQAGGEIIAKGGVTATTGNFSNGLAVGGTSGMVIPVGTTAQRPANPVQGTIRYNTTTSHFEGYNGSGWVNLDSGI